MVITFLFWNNLMDNYLFCIDAGFVATGISLFKVNGGKFVFTGCMTSVTKKSDKKKQVRVADDDSERIKKIIIDIDEFIKPYEHQRIMAAVELPTGGAQGARANRTMGMITGAMVTYLRMKGWPAEYVTPNDVKVAVTGNRKASKDKIMNLIRKKLKKYNHLLPSSKAEFEHVADSVGVALHIKRHSEMFRILTQG